MRGEAGALCSLELAGQYPCSLHVVLNDMENCLYMERTVRIRHTLPRRSMVLPELIDNYYRHEPGVFLLHLPAPIPRSIIATNRFSKTRARRSNYRSGRNLNRGIGFSW